MSFKASISNPIGFSDLATFAKRMGDTCVFRFDSNQVELAIFTNGITSTAGFINLETEALFSRYTIESPINMLVPTRELQHMVFAVKRCNFTNLELKKANEEREEGEEYYLEFKSESTTRTGAIAEEVGELDVMIITDRQASDVQQPVHMTPDVCLTLKPLGHYINFVKGLSSILESIVISASGNGEFRLDYAGLNVVAEHVGTKLQRPELDIDVPLPEDMTKLFKVRVRSKHFVNVLSCEELDVKDTFVSITDEYQIVFFIFFSLGGHTRNSLTVHIPLFIE